VSVIELGSIDKVSLKTVARYIHAIGGDVTIRVNIGEDIFNWPVSHE
jgi:hypothetical protein